MYSSLDAGDIFNLIRALRVVYDVIYSLLKHVRTYLGVIEISLKQTREPTKFTCLYSLLAVDFYFKKNHGS